MAASSARNREFARAGQLVPWMFGIARRVMMDRLRQKYRQEALLENALDDLKATADEGDEHERRDDIANVLDKLENLPLAQRELLTLYYLDGLSIEEVGDVLASPSGRSNHDSFTPAEY